MSVRKKEQDNKRSLFTFENIFSSMKSSAEELPKEEEQGFAGMATQLREKYESDEKDAINLEYYAKEWFAERLQSAFYLTGSKFGEKLQEMFLGENPNNNDVE